jgi:hypothetical protein
VRLPRGIRKPTRLHQAAPCRSCGKSALGITTVEVREWETDSVTKSFHFCEACLEEITETPLEIVLHEFVDDSFDR